VGLMSFQWLIVDDGAEDWSLDWMAVIVEIF